MSTTSHVLPTPDVIIEQLAALQDESAALKRLLRASQAFYQAKEARTRRQAAAARARQQRGGTDAA